MRLSACLLVPVLSAALGHAAIPPKVIRDSTGRALNLVWHDEFEGKGAPDARKWTPEVGFVRNQELQYYTAGRLENARQEGGRLVLETRREAYANPAFAAGATDWKKARREAAYTSACLVTEGQAAWRYGRFEVRAKLPQGRGIWPAIWTLGADRKEVGYPLCGEIDLMELVGHEPNVVYATVHAPALPTGTFSAHGKVVVPDSATAFHTYILEWTPERMRFFVDDRPIYTYEKAEHEKKARAWPFDKPHFLMLNTAVGGAWGGQKGVDDAIFPQRFEIDYVRIYQ